MFWLSAMPTPDLQCRQRLLTLMLDDEIAAPSWPLVSSQAARPLVSSQAAIDKVIQLVLYWLPVGEKLHTVTGAIRDPRVSVMCTRLAQDNTSGADIIGEVRRRCR
jgi:hypothetical protein